MTNPHTCPTCYGHGTVDADQLAAHLANLPGAARTNHPATSHTAARRPSNVVRFGTQRYQVLLALSTGSNPYRPGTSEPDPGRAHGMTAAEVASAVGLSRNQTATRLGECRQVGLVEWARDWNGTIHERPTSRTGDTGRVQRLTATGVAALHAARSRK